LCQNDKPPFYEQKKRWFSDRELWIGVELGGSDLRRRKVVDLKRSLLKEATFLYDTSRRRGKSGLNSTKYATQASSIRGERKKRCGTRKRTQKKYSGRG